MFIIKQIWCWLTHSKHLWWNGYGDWRFQHCDKCGDTWPVMAHQVRGPRKEDTRHD
jgi:hypothetical protein